MAANSQGELEREVRRIYAEAIAYADEAGGVESGMNILYTPPRMRPRLMIVTMQGGGGDGVRQSTWPNRNLYADRDYHFGKMMTDDFDKAGMSQLFREETVATNLAFPQAKEFGKWRTTSVGKGWLQKSSQWLDELIELMAPRALLTYGSPPFEWLTGERKVGGNVGEGSYRGIPVVGCSHYARNRATPEERCAVMAKVRSLSAS